MALTGEYVHRRSITVSSDESYSGEHRSFGVPAEKNEKKSTKIEVLDAYAVERWEVRAMDTLKNKLSY